MSRRSSPAAFPPSVSSSPSDSEWTGHLTACVALLASSLSLVKVSTVAVSAVTFRTVSARSSAFSVLSRSRDVSLAANSEALAADSSASRVLAATCCSKAWTDSRSSSLVGREKSSA